MDFGEVESSAFHPYKKKKSCGIRVGPDLFSVLGGGSIMVGGRVHFESLLLKNDHINT